MNTQASEQVVTGSTKDDAFAFIKSLALELSSGKIELPSFPDVALQVRKVLSDEFVSSKQVVRVVSTEPALAAKLLLMANSAALNPGGPKVVELRTAITRIGFNMVRSASLAFAMEQIRKAESLKSLRGPLNVLWERSVLVAALSFVVAKRHTQVNPDTALLAGLLHGVGKLYIMARAAKHPMLFADQPTYSQIVRDWHASIAKPCSRTGRSPRTSLTPSRNSRTSIATTRAPAISRTCSRWRTCWPRSTNSPTPSNSTCRASRPAPACNSTAPAAK
jgi:hypothetical protein